MRRPALLIFFWLLGGSAWADYLVFEDGRHLKVREVHFLGEQVEVLLLPQGRMLMSARGVRYVTTDADVEQAPEPAPAERLAPGWHGFTDPRFVATIMETAERHGVEAALVAAVIKVESDFRLSTSSMTRSQKRRLSRSL